MAAEGSDREHERGGHRDQQWNEYGEWGQKQRTDSGALFLTFMVDFLVLLEVLLRRLRARQFRAKQAMRVNVRGLQQLLPLLVFWTFLRVIKSFSH